MDNSVDYVFSEKECISNIGVMEQSLRGLLAGRKKKQILLDMRSVKQMDLAAIQLFASFIRSCREEERPVAIRGPLDPLLMDTLEEIDLVHTVSGEAVIFSQIRGGCAIEC